jgi:hypothetical protein
MSLENNLRNVLGSQTTDKSIRAQAVLAVIQSAPAPEEKVDLLAIALCERESVTKNPKSLPNKGITQECWDELAKTHADMVNGHMKMAFFKTHNAKDFAAEILRLVDFFSDENEKTYVLAKALFSPFAPYHQLPGTPAHMTDSEYNHKLRSGGDRVQLIDYIIGLPFDERSERMSVLLQVVDDTTDKDLRVALLSHALFKLESKVIQRMRAEMNP